jgi:siderophore synthetase component
MRIHAPRAARWLRDPLWPGSVILTTDVDVMRAKVGYTALQAHLGEIILRLGQSHGLDEARAWAAVRSIVDEVYDDLASVPGLRTRAREDHAFLTGPVVPHKALLRMRLRAAPGTGGDHYVGVANALGRQPS